MALVGGGGAPNVAGSNPAGTGTSLNYIGNYAYAYSGEVGVDNNTTTLLEFETGSQSVVGQFAIQNGSGSGDDMRYILSFNGERVCHVYSGSSDVFNQFQFPIDIIIPAFTTVLLTAQNVVGSSERSHTVTLTGVVF